MNYGALNRHITSLPGTPASNSLGTVTAVLGSEGPFRMRRGSAPRTQDGGSRSALRSSGGQSHGQKNKSHCHHSSRATGSAISCRGGRGMAEVDLSLCGRLKLVQLCSREILHGDCRSSGDRSELRDCTPDHHHDFEFRDSRGSWTRRML
jgi:hypothetical protein